MNIKKIIKEGATWKIPSKKMTIIGIPVNGEKLKCPQVGLSQGFIHFINEKEEIVGFCGIDYFEHNGIKIKYKISNDTKK